MFFPGQFTFCETLPPPPHRPPHPTHPGKKTSATATVVGQTLFARDNLVFLSKQFRIFNVHIDVNACDCTRACTDTVRESALKVDSGRKSLAAPGESTVCRRRAGPMLEPVELHPLMLKTLVCKLIGIVLSSGR